MVLLRARLGLILLRGRARLRLSLRYWTRLNGLWGRVNLCRAGLVLGPGLGDWAHLLLAGVGLLGLSGPGVGLGWLGLDLGRLDGGLGVVNLVVAGVELLLLAVVDLVVAAGV